MLYYVDGDFSRNHVNEGYISLHPAGIHGIHPGAMEKVLEKKTDEFAVMVDTFAFKTNTYSLSENITTWGVNILWVENLKKRKIFYHYLNRLCWLRR